MFVTPRDTDGPACICRCRPHRVTCVAQLLSFNRIAQLGAEAAGDLRLPTPTVAATPGGEGPYAELLITFATKGDERRQLLVGIDRSQTAHDVKRAILAELSERGDH